MDGNPGQSPVAVTLAAALKRNGVEVLFGQSLPTALHLVAPDFGMLQVNYRAENAGGVMADAYARISGKIGVVTAQNGPAATLLVAPLAEAIKASVPVLAIVQEVNRDQTDRNAFQEFDHFGLFQSCAKWIKRIDVASRVEDYVDMAITAATTGRPGPAVLLCPADLLVELHSSIDTRQEVLGTFPLDRSVPDPARIAEAAALLAQAKNPLVIAGGGVHLSQATAALSALQDEAHLPVATTNMGKGAADETHPLTVGVLANALGSHSPFRHQKPLLDEADVVLLIGTRTNQNGTDSWKLYPPKARFIHLDIDGMEIGRNYEALRLQGDARLGIEALLAALKDAGLDQRKAARAGIEARIAEGRAKGRDEAAPVTQSDSAPMRPERMMAELDKLIDADTIVCADASYSSLWIVNFLTAKRAGQRFITPRGIAGLGWGMPFALGAKVADPAKKVVVLVGDGGFAHTWAELETARRMGLAVTVIVLNNGILGFQKHGELSKFGDHTGAIFFTEVDHAKIAEGAGVRGIRCENVEQFVAGLKEGLASDKPVLLDVMTSPDAHPPIAAFEGKL
ncbi:acetolactate synthase catalytic subunit [Oceanicola sp. 22II-s10i]|uniref:acetolactate synthase catalytic subunit n=1 Tax=Oceanicola sp. 22II-s10i TaxID=1317116 RepID=UPI000B527247|nr:acetolactate synthase catalytic subunit [Oceanicola sp. 22II-s10i]OWU85699.1 acetolactate synthase catalytic subunit [Oceanicola sp. 22II-s10i]